MNFILSLIFLIVALTELHGWVLPIFRVHHKYFSIAKAITQPAPSSSFEQKRDVSQKEYFSNIRNSLFVVEEKIWLQEHALANLNVDSQS